MDIKEISELKLKEIFSEIINGYSTEILDSEIIYIKHLNLYDLNDIDIKHNSFFKAAQKRGLKSEKELEEIFISRGLWTKKAQVDTLTSEIETLEENLNLDIYKNYREVEAVENEVVKRKEELHKLRVEKAHLLGLTAENFASQKTDYYYIFISFFKDKLLKTPYFTKDEFNNLEEDKVLYYISIYNQKREGFNSEIIKKISLFPNFTNLFYLCDDDSFKLFGKSLLEMSFYQSELFSFAKYYKSLIKNAAALPPAHAKYDPEELEAWYEGIMADKEVRQRNPSNSGKVSSKGFKDSSAIVEMAKKNGGSMNMKEAMAAHGIIVPK